MLLTKTPPDHADWADAFLTCPSGADATPPTVTGRTPAAGATGVAVGAHVTATFSEAMLTSSITSATFTLTANGSATPIAATVSYDGASRTAILNPNAALAPGR